MPQKENIEDDREEERQGRDDPNDQGEQHGKVDNGLLPISRLGHGFDVDEELRDGRLSLGGSMIANGDDLSLHDSPEGQGVYGNPWALSEDNDQSAWACQNGSLRATEAGTFELEVDEESNVVDALLTLGELCED